MAAANVTGSITLNASFTETITAGVIQTINLPTGINQNVNYQNALATGASLTTDVIYGAQKGLTSNTFTLAFNALPDLNGTAQSWARVRELHIQNLNSFPIYVFASSSSGVPWLGSTSTTGIMIPGNNSANSTTYATLRLCDPVTSGVASGYYISTSSYNLVVSCAAGASSNSVNVMAAGCTVL